MGGVMGGYPVIYWVVVLIVAGAVSTVLMGIGYLIGQKIAARRVADLREESVRAELERFDRRPTEFMVPLSALPGPKKGRIR